MFFCFKPANEKASAEPNILYLRLVGIVMKVGVYGSGAGDIGEEVEKKAVAIGRGIAERGHTVVTGACPGIPYQAVLAARDAGGETIGFSPAVNLKQHKEDDRYPSKGFSELIFIPDDYDYANVKDARYKYRSISSIVAVDAAVIIGGRTGTMNEFTNLHDMGKDIGVLKDTGGITDRAIEVLMEDIDKEKGARVIFESDPDKLLDRLLG